MESMKFAQQMIEFYKTNFNNAFKAVSLLQEQMHKTFKLQLSQTVGLPEEGQKAIDDWYDSYVKASEQFKTGVNEGFDKLETYFADHEESKKGEA